MMGKRGLIFVALVAIGFVFNPVVPFWLFATVVAILFAVWRILPVRSGPRPLRGASMVHVPADLEDIWRGCTKPPGLIGVEDFPPYTPIEITREELDSSDVRPYNGCTRGGGDPWTKTGGSSSTRSGPAPTRAAAPTATQIGSEEGE